MLKLGPRASAESPPPPQSIAPDVSHSRVSLLAERAREYMMRVLDRADTDRLYYTGMKIMDLNHRAMYFAHVVKQTEALLLGRPLDTRMKEALQWKWKPVDIETFVCDPYYLGKKDEIYPKVLQELIEINSGKYVEVVFTGGIGSAKTTSALYTCAYQLYLLSCMHNPHKVFGQDSAAEMLFIFQSINAKLAKGVDFNRFKSMIEVSPYFKEHFPFDRNVESKLVFPRRIEVVPVSGSDTAAIGQNVIGGLIDELNYMAVVEKSKMNVDSGTYDQAIALYNSIARRRKSRFMSNGKLPGILCLVSSKKYPGQFTDQKEEEAKTDPTIYIYDKRVWDVKPDGTFAKDGWFMVFIGDETQKPRIIEAGEKITDQERPKVIRIPLDFIGEFRKDIINGLREIAGISTLARHPYFLETAKVFKSMGRHHSIFGEPEVDFVSSKLTLRSAAFFKPELPRFVHVDLAISGDSAGLCVGTVKGFRSMKSLGMSDNDHEMMPEFHIDGVLRVRPPRNAEIQFWKIREVIVALRTLGMNMRWVTFDSFQSVDSQQLLRQQGFITGLQSMDVTPCLPYDYLKSAVYDGRVAMPSHDKLRTEILSLERSLKTGKVDHPPAGSKDCADALAGVVYGLTMRREMWGLFKVPLVSIPNAIRIKADRLEDKNDEKSQQQAQQMRETT
jgi:hypothetical protein